MDRSIVETPSAAWRVEPNHLSAMLPAHDGPVIVDLDETLYLRNSTEDFIDCAYPNTAARLLMTVLDVVQPWRLTSGAVTRDVWRLAIVLCLFPWTVLVWRLRCAGLAARHANRELDRALAQRSDIILATNGFRLIVRPLVAKLLPGRRTLVSCRLRAADKRAGKLALLDRQVGRSIVTKALVITDSLDDAPLLAACARPCLVRWPEARYREALSDVYLPLDYLRRVKRPNSRYIWHSIVQEDFAFWALACLPAMLDPPLVLAALVLLIISFWAAYETGYVDNDRMAVRFEAEPTLSRSFAGHRVPTPPVAPWIWAAFFGVAGVTLLDWPAPPHAAALLAWATVLVGTKACFALFNRIDKRTRVWLFAVLQTARAAGILAVVSTSAVGVAGLAAHAVALWFPYFQYRIRPGAGWPDLPVFAVRLMVFFLFALLLLAGDGGTFDWPLAGAFLAWNLFRARKEVAAIVGAAHRIDRETPRQQGRPAPSVSAMRPADPRPAA